MLGAAVVATAAAPSIYQEANTSHGGIRPSAAMGSHGPGGRGQWQLGGGSVFAAAGVGPAAKGC